VPSGRASVSAAPLLEPAIPHDWFADLGAFDIAMRLILGAVIGFLIGLTGVGGGSMVIPALTLGLGLPPAIAVPTANFFSFLTKISAFATHWKLRTIAWRPVAIFLVGAAPGTVLASWLVKSLVGPQDELANQILLWLVFAVVVVSILLLLGARRRRALEEIDPADDEPEPATPTPPAPRPLGWRGVLAGLAVGLVIGSTSVGGGVVVIPLLALCFAMPMERNVGSSIAIALALTLVATIAYVVLPGPGGQAGSAVDKPTGILMALGALGGVIGGSVLAKKMPESRLHRTVVGTMCLAAGLIALKGLEIV
jgi:uncharacterized protein